MTMNIKYLEHVKIIPNCVYVCNDAYKNFSSNVCFNFEEAVEFMLDNKKRKGSIDKDSGMILIQIFNPNALDYIPDPKLIRARDSKDILCQYAKIRNVYFSRNMKEIYFESFNLMSSCNSSCSHSMIYDYGLLYGNLPTYNDDHYFRSSIMNQFDENVFVPFKKPNLDSMVTGIGNDILCCYCCDYGHGTNENDWDIFGLPSFSFPASTFIQLGNINEISIWNK